MVKMNKKPIVVTFKLFPGKDDDLIEFLRGIGVREKSSYIRLAIRSHFVTKVYSNPGCFSAQLDLSTVPQGGPSIIVNPKVADLSDDELEARLSRW